MPDPTLYLFDGYNLLHAGAFTDARELVDRLADFVAIRGARGVVVFDGVGDRRRARPAVRPLRRRTRTRCSSASPPSIATASASASISSDEAVRGTSGQEVRKLTSRTFVRDLEQDRASRAGEPSVSASGWTTRRAPGWSGSAAVQ